jgi:cobalt-zinc-cadmium efflux system membrane fusion protein
MAEKHAFQHLCSSRLHRFICLTPAQYKNAGITTGKIATKQISSHIKANGKLQGTLIKRGEVVATLQHPDLIQLQQDYLENHSQEEYLQADYERETSLAKDNVNAKNVYEPSKATQN